MNGNDTTKEWEEPKNCILCDSPNTVQRKGYFRTCGACGHSFISPRPTQDTIAGHYSQATQYDSWVEQSEGRKKMWARRLMLLKRFASSGKLLDVGAGLGEFLSHAKSSFEATGTELSSAAVDYAAKTYGVKLFCGQLESAKISESSFDAITLWHVLEHLPNPGASLEFCRKLLSLGGVLVVAVPNCSWGTWSHFMMIPRNIAKFALNLIGKKYFYDARIAPIHLKPGEEIHLSCFTPKVLTDYLAQHGFEILDSGLDSYPAQFHFFKRLVYYKCKFIKGLTGLNLYPAFYVAARKK